MSENEGLRAMRIDALMHHPDNPRKSIGDIEELTDSIRKNGVMQNLTVVPAEDELGKFWVLIGNRRFEAEKKAGLDELPCRVAEGLSKIEQIGIMLEENMQRADLTIVEQAQGFQLMLDMGETVAGIAQSIEELNALVGGMSTAVTIPDNGLKLIMNVNSKRRRKPTLKTLWGRIYGTVLIMAADGDTFIDLTPDQVQSARGWLLRHTYEEVTE